MKDGFLLPSRGFWELNSGYQVWQGAPLLPEPVLLPLPSLKTDFVVVIIVVVLVVI